MQLGIVGLGKMGANMAKRLLNAGHAVVGFDLSKDSVSRIESRGWVGEHLPGGSREAAEGSARRVGDGPAREAH